MHVLPAHKQTQVIANAVMQYLEAQDRESPVYSVTHLTLIRLVQNLADLGIEKERFYRALDRTYGNTANW